MFASESDVAAVGAFGALAVVAIGVALIVALIATEIIAAVTRRLGRGHLIIASLIRRARIPLRAVLIVIALWIALRIATPGGPDRPEWMGPTQHVLLIGLIVATGWLTGALAFLVEDATFARYRSNTPDNRHARRVRTQVSVIRRLTVVLLVAVVLGASLLTFHHARRYGAAILTSAGVLSVIVGLAAQTSLANVFAGIQLAFTDALRLDDVVVVDGYWGHVEEITLTYVVVHVWDDRRVILPSTYFSTTPFENWTRRAADLLGTIEIDVDWSVPVDEMRIELTRLLEANELWDQRVGLLQVTDALNGMVRVRALASARDAQMLWDLRCAVREGLVSWLQRAHPESLPRTRYESPMGGRTTHLSLPGMPGGSAGPPDGGVEPDSPAEDLPPSDDQPTTWVN
jgi:small-conductance mechanosensitive channel